MPLYGPSLLWSACWNAPRRCSSRRTSDISEGASILFEAKDGSNGVIESLASSNLKLRGATPDGGGLEEVEGVGREEVTVRSLRASSLARSKSSARRNRAKLMRSNRANVPVFFLASSLASQNHCGWPISDPLSTQFVCCAWARMAMPSLTSNASASETHAKYPSSAPRASSKDRAPIPKPRVAVSALSPACGAGKPAASRRLIQARLQAQ